MKFTLAQLAQLLDGTVEGNPQLEVTAIGTIQEAGPEAISFLANPKYEDRLYDTQAGAVIIKEDYKLQKEVTTSLIRVADPYNSFTRLLEEYDKLTRSDKTGVEEPSYVGEGAKVGQGVYRGAFSYIGAGAEVGDGAKIYPHAYVGDGAKIGPGTVLYSGVKVYHGCQVGSNCILHSGAVVGSDGFGFAPQKDGSYKKIPQVGNVIVGDHVEIGANTTVDRATLEATVIESGVKLDNLIQIAHNVKLGEHTAVAAQAGISGSTEIGHRSMVAGQVGVVGHLKIAPKTTLGAQAGVTKDINTEGGVWTGSPAIDHKDFVKSIVLFRQLPTLANRIKELEQKLLNLPTH